MTKIIPSEVSKPQSLRVLMVEDSERDELLIIRELKKGSYEPEHERVETADAFKRALSEKQWDIILCDYKMPNFSAPSAIALLKETNTDISVIIVSGAIGEDVAVECMRLGAHDYVMKTNLSRLCPAIARELEEAKVRVQRRQSEEALKESEKKYRLLADNIQDVIFMLDMHLQYTYISPSVKTMRGYEPEEVLKQQPIEQVLTPSSRDIALNNLSEIMELEKSGRREEVPLSRTLQLEMWRKDGTTLWTDVRFSFIRDENQRPIAIMGVTRDITERKRAEDTLRVSEQRYRIAEAIGHVGNWEYNLQTTKFWGSDEAKRIYGFDPDTLDFTTDEVESCIPERERVHQALVDLIEADKPYNLEFEIHPKNSLKPRIISSVAELKRDEHGNPLLVKGFIQDITKRRQDESARVGSLKALLESQERYNALFDRSLNVICVMDFNGQFIDANNAALNLFGYKREDIHSVNINSLMDEDQLPRALETIREITQTGIQKDLHEIRLRNKDGREIYLETQGSIIMSKGKPASIQIIARDITQRKLADLKYQQTLESLRKSINTTIQVMVSAVEARDPYTAGHQLRVADLARTIATAMGLAPDKIEGIRMAGSIHDIGKLSTPTEILVKPTKLTKIEFSMIKEHPQNGYELLKNVESPWPLAQIVYQHHERMNGSGYPRNLKGDEILLEARIMAVADVVEAMASHRPYRASLGIEAALEEIEKNKGILYDDVVADACLKLFREKGYQFK